MKFPPIRITIKVVIVLALTLPEVISTAHIVSSSNCQAIDDGLHFSAQGYRDLGKRYGDQMVQLLGRRARK